VSCEQITFSTNECETLRLLLLRLRSGGTAVHIAFVLFLFPLSYPSPHPPWTTLSNLAAPSRSPLTGIDSPSDVPKTIDCKLIQLAPREQEVLDKFLDEHLKKKYITTSNLDYASPFFFVKKKDGKLRPVQDYRAINKYTKRNMYLLPLIKEIIAQIRDVDWFTKFDIRWGWGYNNIQIKDGDQPKAAFKTNRGLFEPNVMFFGLTNSPATFQMMMDAYFREEITKGKVFIYMDDILIPTKGSLQQHNRDIVKVLKKLLRHNLYLNPEKCYFHKKQVEYLGVIIGNGKVQMDPIKTRGLTDWPQPTKLKELHSFLGFGNYYRDFISNYSHIARPLNELTKKNTAYIWSKEAEQAFQTLKKAFTLYPVLRNHDPERRYILETDTSDFAMGATLAQDFKDGCHPVAYFSKSLLPAEQNYQIADKELLAIIRAVQAFRHLLLGAKHKILIRSDHKNLKYFKSSRKITPRQARWYEFLEDYDFELEHLPGHTNTVADLLSRRSDLNKGVDINNSIQILPNHLFVHKTGTSKKIYLEDDNETHRNILREIHDTLIGGHPSISNTWYLVNRNYEGPLLRKFVEQYVKGCAKCQEVKPKTTLKRAPLQPFDMHASEGPFKYVSMDLITNLPKSGKYDAILTIVDQGCSKVAKFIPCNKTIDGKGTAILYFKHLFPLFGIPKRIISDRDPRFTAHFTRAVCKATGI
jgi:hypothetical protein